MRFSAIGALFAMLLATWGPAAHGEGFRHNWREVQAEGEIKYVSSYPAPVVFSETGEPEATLSMQAAKLPVGKGLKDIAQSEIADIREGLAIADYLEEDGHKPDRGIASYTEDIDGQNVAFIKYRVAGTHEDKLAHPRSVIHAILVKDGTVYYVHLIVLYAGHQDEVREDQMRLVRAIIRHR